MSAINKINNFMLALVFMLLLSCNNSVQSSKEESKQTTVQVSVQTIQQDNLRDTADVIDKPMFIHVDNGFKEDSSTYFTDALPNMDIAFHVAFTILSGIYGKDHCEEYYPYKGYLLNNSVWVFYGTKQTLTEGGFPYIEINKHDGKVIRLTHYK